MVEHEDDEMDKVHPDRGDEETMRTMSSHLQRFTAVVVQPGSGKRYRIRAEQTAKWRVRRRNSST